MNLPFLSEESSNGKPYCTAPYTSICVNPNKDVRPCCTFDGSMGNLKHTSLKDILTSSRWNEVQEQISRGDTPTGCVNCYEREKATGWSVRKADFDAGDPKNARWNTGLTQLEIDSSNICNLACTHCSSNFSSRWLQLSGQFGKEVAYHHLGPDRQVQGPDPENIIRQIAGVDLRSLEVVRFKGGEPMLNHDVPAVLRYFLDRGILRNVSVNFVSNGSVLNEEVFDLLRHAGRVTMCVSVDGTGRLQEYIRRGPSEIARIEGFLDTLSSLERIRFTMNVSVMAYNVFSLDRISDWWNGFCRKSPDKFMRPSYDLHVVDPARLSVHVLQDPTRQSLVRKYRDMSDADYSSVIHSLQQPFGGALLHNEFVTYTRDMDRVWHADVLDVVPELAQEMVLLEVPAARKSRWSLSFSPAVESGGDTLQKGMSLSQSGKYREAVRLYDRYLEANATDKLTSKWEISLHRAIVLGKMEKWELSFAAFYGLIRVSPARALQAMESRHGTEQGGVLSAISQNLATETGFVQSPSFRLVLEGLSYRALENHTKAVATLIKALELDPEFALAQVAIREMRVVA